MAAHLLGPAKRHPLARDLPARVHAHRSRCLRARVRGLGDLVVLDHTLELLDPYRLDVAELSFVVGGSTDVGAMAEADEAGFVPGAPGGACLAAARRGDAGD